MLQLRNQKFSMALLNDETTQYTQKGGVQKCLLEEYASVILLYNIWVHVICSWSQNSLLYKSLL